MMPPEWPSDRSMVMLACAVVLFVGWFVGVLAFSAGVRCGRAWESQERREAYEAFQREAKHWHRK